MRLDKIRDFKKYKRFFVFGCSFTNFQWPTWADILHQEMPNVTFYNFGQSGGGNLFITSRVSETHKKFNFSKDDLVIIMWSTYCREDRWYEGEWITKGNVFTSFEKDYVQRYIDPLGLIIRDASLISLTLNFLDTLECDSYSMKLNDMFYEFDDFPIPFEKNPTRERTISEVKNLYSNIDNSIPIGFNTYLRNKEPNYFGHRYYHHVLDETQNDPHPNPESTLEYLKHIGFSLSESTKQYALESQIKLKKCKTLYEILAAFPEVDFQRTYARRLLF